MTRSIAVTSAGTCAGASSSRFVSARCTIDSKQDAEHADRDRGRLRDWPRPAGRTRAQRSRIRSASSRRMRLRNAFTSGDVPTPSSRMMRARRGIGDEVVDVRADADLGEVVVGRRVLELAAHRVEQRAQARLQRAVHRVFAVVEERVERGAARVRAADDVFDRRVVVAARGELVDRGADEPSALIGAALLGGQPAVAPSAGGRIAASARRVGRFRLRIGRERVRNHANRLPAGSGSLVFGHAGQNRDARRRGRAARARRRRAPSRSSGTRAGPRRRARSCGSGGAAIPASRS